MNMKFFTKKRLIIGGAVVLALLLFTASLGSGDGDSSEGTVLAVDENGNPIYTMSDLKDYDFQSDDIAEEAIIANYEETSPIVPLDIPEPNPASDFDYQLSDTGDGVVITKYKGTSPIISIPSEIEGMPVTEIYSFTGGSFSSEFNYLRQSILQVFFPDTVTRIADGLCEGFKNLNYARLSENCQTISYHMFYECESLTHIEIPEAVTKIGGGAFYGTGFVSIKIPSTITEFGDYIFASCKNLVHVELPENMTVLPGGIFNDCESLETVHIPESVREIEDSCVSGTAISEISLPKNLEKIGDECFYGCKNLQSIEIPDTVTSIGARAFKDTPITELYIPESVQTKKGIYDSKEYFSISFIYGMKKLEVLRLPNSIERIDDKPLYSISGGRSRFFPDEVKETLRSVNLPSSVKYIGDYTFSNFTNLTELIIPDSLTKIDIDILAFGGTSKLPLLTQKRLKDLGYRGIFVDVE